MNTLQRSIRAAGLAAALSFSGSLALAGDDPKGVSFLEGSPPFANVLAQAKKEGKPVFIDFQTAWCGWCRRLEKDVFAQPSVGKRMSAFVNVDYDADQGEGRSLAERFHVHGFPTLVIVDPSGAEIDRLEGYRSAEAFTEEIERIQKGEDTLPALQKKAADSPNDLSATLALARKLTVASPSDAVTLLDQAVQKAKGRDRMAEADAWMSLARAARNANDGERAKAACDRVLAEFADTDYAAEALQAMVPPRDPEAALAFLEKARKDAKNPKVAAFADAVIAEIHLRAAAGALRRRAEAAGDDAQALNEIAWTCFEHKMNLKSAVGWARKAVELSKRDPAILDTLANLLFATGMNEEALKVEQEALDAAKSEALKAEFGETMAKLKAAVAFRIGHPSAAALAALAAAESDDEEGEAAEGQMDSSPASPSGGAKPPTPAPK